jgi:hypothetical protein
MNTPLVECYALHTKFLTGSTKVGLENVAVGNTRANGESQIDQGIDFYGLEILANKCQTSMGTEVVGQPFNNEVGHVCAHLQGEQNFTPKSLIYIGKS